MRGVFKRLGLGNGEREKKKNKKRTMKPDTRIGGVNQSKGGNQIGHIVIIWGGPN